MERYPSCSAGAQPADTIPPKARVYQHDLTVATTDLDEQGHVNNLVYVRWVEEIATAHWKALTTPEIRAEVGWVLLRHEIDYRRPVGPGETVEVRTWLADMERLRVDRRVEFRRAGEVVASSRTIWCPVDPRTGRPRRVGDDLRVLFAEPSAR